MDQEKKSIDGTQLAGEQINGEEWLCLTKLKIYAPVRMKTLFWLRYGFE